MLPRTHRYWAPDSFIDSALATKAQFEASLKLPAGVRCMLERAARGFKDNSAAVAGETCAPATGKSEYMA